MFRKNGIIFTCRPEIFDTSTTIKKINQISSNQTSRMSLPKLDPKDADALMKEMGLTTSKYSTIDDFIKCYALAKGDIETTARFYQNSNVRKKNRNKIHST